MRKSEKRNGSLAIKTLYNSEYYQRHVNLFFKNPSVFHRNRKKQIFNLLQPKKGEKILDLGCGIGTISILCEKYGADVTGLDYSEKAVGIARELTKIYGNGSARFVIGDATKLKFREKSFDKIIAADLIEHITDEQFIKMLKCCYKVLRKEGKLIIYTPTPTHYTEKLRKLGIIKTDKSHIGIKDMKQIINALESNGFKIKAAFYKPIFLPVVKQIEILLMHFPLIGKYFRRRNCVIAEK